MGLGPLGHPLCRGLTQCPISIGAGMGTRTGFGPISTSSTGALVTSVTVPPDILKTKYAEKHSFSSFFFLFFVETFLFNSGRISNYKSGLPHHPGEQSGYFSDSTNNNLPVTGTAVLSTQYAR